MLILVRHAPPFRRWHRRLGERLAQAGHRTRFETAGKAPNRLLPFLERRLYGIAPDWDAAEAAPPAETWVPHLTVVLAETSPPGGGAVVTIEINGLPGEAALELALRSGVAPHIAVRGGPAGSRRLLASGRPALEDPRVRARAAEAVLPRLVSLVAQGIASLASGEEARDVANDRAVSDPDRPGAFVARGLCHKLVRRFGPAQGRPDHWRLALRRTGAERYVPLPDDPAFFRADPFLFAEAGRLWLFYEEYPYASGKGVIGAVALDAGACGPPALVGGGSVVLEEPFHLSYPLVLRYAGAIFMLPETSAAGGVHLYRADPFPSRWLFEAVLVEGRRLADATPVFHEGRWWLFATTDDDGGSSWDQLELFHAPDLRGPWTPHPRNPVLIDAGAARPAGAMWHENGVLMRPAQDCRRGYGDGVAICRVDRLDGGGYAQTVVRRLEPPPGLGATGLHTLNTTAGWEAIDLRSAHTNR